MWAAVSVRENAAQAPAEPLLCSTDTFSSPSLLLVSRSATAVLGPWALGEQPSARPAPPGRGPAQPGRGPAHYVSETEQIQCQV